MLVSVCKSVQGKPQPGDFAAFGRLAYKFENVQLTQSGLASAINQGFAITTQHTGGDDCKYNPIDPKNREKHKCHKGHRGNHRKAENFKAGQHIGLDFDGVESESVVTENGLIKQYGSVIHHTTNSRADDIRMRVIVELSEPIYDPEEYKLGVLSLMWKLHLDEHGLDDKCKDPCRIFYGAVGKNPIVTGKVLPLQKLREFIEEYKTSHPKIERPVVDVPINPTNGDKRRQEAYVRAALNGELERVRTAPKGERNNTLFKAAATLGSLSANGYIDDWTIESELQYAATQCGLDEHEILSAIASGMERGKRNPRTIVLPDEQGFFFRFRAKDETGEDEEYPEEVTENKSPEDFPDKNLLEFEPNDEGNALAFMSVYGKDFLFCKALGWLSWNGKFWDKDRAESLLDQRVVEVMKRRVTAAVKVFSEGKIKEIIKVSTPNSGRISACIERLPGKLEVLVEEFDSDPNLLNCNNGVLNLKTGVLTPHDPSQRFTYATKINYFPGADYSEWTKFLAQVVGSWDEIKDFLQQSVGYSLTGHTNEEVLFYIYGPTRSGKGTFSEVIMEMLGDNLSTEVDFNTFTAKREGDSNNFDLAPLKPSRVVFASESTRYQMLNPAKIKQLTGGNKIRCCFKHKDHFTYRPQFKMWMSSNWSVNGDVDDDALWGRVRVIQFPNSFYGKEDKTLKEYLKNPAILEGVLAWAVQGSIAWYKQNQGLVTPEVVLTTTKAHRVESDYTQMWLDECTERDETYWTSNADLMHSYQRWCQENGVEPKQMRSLATALKTKGYSIGVQKKSGSTNSKGTQGLRIVLL